MKKVQRMGKNFKAMKSAAALCWEWAAPQFLQEMGLTHCFLPRKKRDYFAEISILIFGQTFSFPHVRMTKDIYSPLNKEE
jgi:hypothetical protein